MKVTGNGRENWKREGKWRKHRKKVRKEKRKEEKIKRRKREASRKEVKVNGAYKVKRKERQKRREV